MKKMKRKVMPAVFLLILTVLLNACSPQTKPVTTAEDGSAAVQETQSAVLTPGTYTATVNAHGGPMTVETVLDGESIISVTITDMYETSVTLPSSIINSFALVSRWICAPS